MRNTLKRSSLTSKKKLKKVFTKFRAQIYSRHPSHDVLRHNLDLLPIRGIVRLGSTTETPNDGKPRIEINSIEAIENSANKLLMKQCFTEAEITTADWYLIFGASQTNMEKQNSEIKEIVSFENLPYPIIAKNIYGSRGTGNYKLDTREQLEEWMRGKNLSNYIFEKFYTYSKEYRIHVTNDGCFYTCRKLLKNETPESEQWHRHDENSVWIIEENPKFMKPSTWDLIIEDCIKAKNALGLDICAFDVKTQGSSKRNPKWIIIESCSAPSFGEITAIKYKEELNKLLKKKLNG